MLPNLPVLFDVPDNAAKYAQPVGPVERAACQALALRITFVTRNSFNSFGCGFAALGSSVFGIGINIGNQIGSSGGCITE